MNEKRCTLQIPEQDSSGFFNLGVGDSPPSFLSCHALSQNGAVTYFLVKRECLKS
jgi:hypothetical protein